MAAIRRTTSYAFEPGERVWLICDIASSGVIDAYRVDGQSFQPRYIVAFPNGESTHSAYELTRDEPNPFQTDSEDE